MVPVLGDTSVCTMQYYTAMRDYVRGVPLACLDTYATEHSSIGSSALKRFFKKMTRNPQAPLPGCVVAQLLSLLVTVSSNDCLLELVIVSPNDCLFQ